jgi:fatty-acyl-CoA synthase
MGSVQAIASELRTQSLEQGRSGPDAGSGSLKQAEIGQMTPAASSALAVSGTARKSPAKTWIAALESVKLLEDRPRLTLPVLMQELAAAHGERPALLGEDATLSYVDLAKQANRYASWAAAQGIGAGDVVCLLMPNCPEYFAIWLGITQAGGAVALLNIHLRGNALAHCIKSAGAERVIVADRLLPALAEVMPHLAATAHCWVHGAAASTQQAEMLVLPPHANSTALEISAPQPKDLALLIYTSGTTGLPKAAKITHARLLEWSFWFAGMMDAGATDRLYNCLPMYHSIGGVVAIGAMLVRGGSVVIREKFSATRFWEDVSRTECTIFQYIGELCRYLLLSEPDEFESRHRLRLACGNGMNGNVWSAFEARFAIPQILEFYAATEGNVSLYNCEAKPGAIGRVPPFLSHRFPIALIKCDLITGAPLRDEAGFCRRAAPDEPGEAIGRIQGNAESQFDGYTDAKASAVKILRDVFEPGDRWFRTGDLMRKDRAGYYTFADRLGDTFRWKGENVSTTEVAEVIGTCPGVMEAVVFGVEIPGNEGRAGMAVITTDAGFSLLALQSLLIKALPSYARPVFIRRCDQLALTGTFKLQKEKLRQEGYAAAAAGAEIWFFDAGIGSFIPCDGGTIERIASSRI